MLNPSRHNIGSSNLIRLTPWKGGTCLLAVVLTFLTVAILYLVIPGEAKQAQVERVGGGIEFVVSSSKQTWITMAFFASLVAYPSLLWWIFRKQLKAEWNQSHRRQHEQQPSRWRLVQYVFEHVVIAIVLGLVGILLVGLLIQEPLSSVRRIIIDGNEVRFESVYRGRNRSRLEVQQVEITREVFNSRRGSYASYQADIRMRDGDVFQTSRISAQPPGGPEDTRYEQFFADLRAELTKP